jgi:hypothetical protein
VGVYPTKGIFARPTVVTIGTILTYYSSDMNVQEAVANKDKNFQQCYQEGIAHCRPILERLESYYADWILKVTESSVQEEYIETLSQELKYYGMFDLSCSWSSF